MKSLAIVLAKSFSKPDLQRGLRGFSGSGRGIRTIVEHLNFFFFYHFDLESNRVDSKVTLERTNQGTIGSHSFHRNDDTSGIIAGIREPSYLGVPLTLDIDHRSQFSSVVTSYEDVMLLSNLLVQFLSAKAQSKHSQVEGGNQLSESSNQLSHEIYFFCAIKAVRVILVDNVLGLHLPFFQVRLI
jgi:hypothetical protein